MGSIPMPGGSSQPSIWANFDKGFNFGGGGMFNGFNQSAIPANSMPNSSGMGNMVPGMPSNSGIPGGSFPANNTTAFGGNFFGGGGTSSIPGGGFPGFPQVQGSVFTDLYGHGVGNALQQFLNSGAGFNQNVVNAEMNAAMPLEARGVENIMNAMGGHGLGSSSTAAIGLGDFESQFNAQLENMFAQQYEQSVQNYLKVLMGTQQDAKEQNAQGSSWLSMLGGMFGDVGKIFTSIPH